MVPWEQVIRELKRACFGSLSSKTFENMVFSKVDMCRWDPWEQVIRKVKRACFGVFNSKTFENMVFSKVDMCRWVPWEQLIQKVKRPCFNIFSSKTFENMVFSKGDMAKKMLFVCAWAISSQHFVSDCALDTDYGFWTFHSPATIPKIAD